METQKITPAIIRSAKIQKMTPEAYLSGLAAIKVSLVRGREAK